MWITSRTPKLYLLVALACAALLPFAAQAAPRGAQPVDVAIDLGPGSPNPVPAGGNVTWIVRVDHLTGQDEVPAGDLSINFNATSNPPGVFLLSSGTNWNCSTNTCTYQVALFPGQTTMDLTLLGTAPGTATPGTIDLTTQAVVNANFVFDNNPSNNSASEQVQVDPFQGEDFFISSIDATPDPANPGQQVTFTLLAGLDDGANGAERGFSFSMDFSLSSSPGGAILDGPPTGTGWNCNTSTCDYVLAISPGGVSNPLTFQTFAGSPGTMTLDALITSDGSPANNAGQRVVTVIDSEDFAFDSVIGTPNPIDAGATGTFEARITRLDLGRGPSSTPVVDFSLSSTPGGATIIGQPSGTDWNCGSSSCTFVGFLPTNTPSPPLVFNVQAPPSGPGSMTLDLNLSPDANSGNNSGTATISVNGPPSDDFLISSISGSPDFIDPSASGNFEVTVERFGIPLGTENLAGLPQPTLSYALSSTPSGAVIVGLPSGTGWSCQAGMCTYTSTLPFNTPTPPLVFDVVAPPSGPGSMTLDVLLEDDANNNNNAGSATLTVNPNAAPLDYRFTTFVGSPSPALTGSTIEFQVAVTQSGDGGGGGKRPDGTSSGLEFDYQLSGTPSAPQLIGTPSGTNWSCSNGTCFFLGSLSDGDTTPPVAFSVRAPSSPGTVTLDGMLFGDDITNNNSGSDSVPVVAEDEPPVQLSLNKSAPGTANVDEDILYTLTVSNVGEPPATQLNLSDQLPPGMTLVSVDQGDWFCTSTPTSVNCSRDVLGSGQQSQVLITVQASEPGDYLNQAQLTASGVPIALNDTALTQIDEVQAPFVDLVLTKTGSVDTVAPGAPFSYDLTVTNLGTLQATGVTITETFPEGMVVVDARGTNWSCSALNVCSLLISLGGGQSSTLTFDVLAPTSVGTITNRANVRSLESDIRPQDNDASEQTTVAGEVAVADLRIQADFAGSIQPGNVSRAVNVLVFNDGPDTAQSVQVQGTVSGVTTLTSAIFQSQPCAVSGNSFTCALNAVAPGGPLGIGVAVTAPVGATGSGSLSVEVSSPTADPQLGNNLAQVELPVISAGADLGVELSDSVDPVQRGGTFDYRLRLINEGPAPAEQATVTINLDPSLSVSAQSTPGLSCTPAGATMQTCALSAPLFASSVLEASFTVQVPLDAPDTLSASAAVTTSQGDPNAQNNNATETTAVDALNEEQIRDQLDDAAINDPIAGPAVPPTAEQCANPSGDFVAFCDQLLQAPPEEVREALAALAPEENTAQATVLREISFAQFFNVDARLAELRGAGGGFSSAGLNLSTRTGSLGFDQLSQMLGGEERQADDAGGLFSSPWGFFVNGTISSGDQSFDGTSGQVGVDFESRGLTAGVDYRFSPSLVVGAALGYASFDSDITGDSSLDTTGYTLTGYGSWYPKESFYIDGRISFGRVEMDQSRRVRFTLNGQTTDLVARGSADADQFSFALGAGFHINRGAWNFTPNASIRYTDSDVDGFTERGAGSFALTYDSTSVDALVASAGLQLSRAYSLSRGVVTPQLSLSWNFENRGDDLAVTGRFANAGGTQSFRFISPETDSNYGALGLGFVFIGANGVQAYVNYRTVFGYEDFDRNTLNLGARFEF